MEPRSEELRRPELGPPLCSSAAPGLRQDEELGTSRYAADIPPRTRSGGLTLALVAKLCLAGIIDQEEAARLAETLLNDEGRSER